MTKFVLRLLALFCFVGAAQAQLSPSKLVATDASNHLTAYAGTACVNKILFDLSASGVATCSTTTWPNTATSGGVLYASAANTWATSGALGSTQLVLGGGAGGAPNTNANLSYDGTTLTLSKTSTITSGTENIGNISYSIAPASASSANHNALYVQPTITGSSAISGAISSLNFVTSHGGTGLMSGLYGVQGLVTATSGTAVGTIATAAYGGNFKVTNASTGTIETAIALLAGNTANAGAPITTSEALALNGPGGTGSISVSEGIEIASMGRSGVSNGYGIVIRSQTGASSRQMGIGIADVGTGATNRANLVLGAALPNAAGSWSIYNQSTFQNAHAGKSFFGGTTAPTALAHFAAGTAAANTAPWKVNTGTLLTTAEAGAFEYTDPSIYFTLAGPLRKEIALWDAAPTNGRIPFVANGRLVDDADITFATDTLTVTKVSTSEIIVTNLAEPTCNFSVRGAVIFVAGGVGVADTWRICTKDAADSYAYRSLF